MCFSSRLLAGGGKCYLEPSKGVLRRDEGVEVRSVFSPILTLYTPPPIFKGKEKKNKTKTKRKKMGRKCKQVLFFRGSIPTSYLFSGLFFYPPLTFSPFFTYCHLEQNQTTFFHLLLFLKKNPLSLFSGFMNNLFSKSYHTPENPNLFYGGGVKKKNSQLLGRWSSFLCKKNQVRI